MNIELERALFSAVVNPVYRLVRRTTMGTWMSFVIYRCSLLEWNGMKKSFWDSLNSGYLEMEGQ